MTLGVRLLKTDFLFETCLLSPGHRANLSKFRCETVICHFQRRDIYVPKACSLCLTADQGDNYNYIFVFPSFDNEKNSSVKQYYSIISSTVKFEKRFNTGNIIMAK